MNDYRCYLRSKEQGADVLFGPNIESNILYPLRKFNKMVFPYTPTIQTGNSASYEDFSMVHSNYKYNAYANSRPNEIVITGDFSAQTQEEAEYMLAVMHFMKSATKMYFGERSKHAGSPPAVMYLNYMGKHQFKDVPVVITTHNYTLQQDVDYIKVDKFDTMVPVYMNLMITLEPNYNPMKVRREFDLDEFRQGKLINKGYI